MVMGATTTAVKPAVVTNLNNAKKGDAAKAPVVNKENKKSVKPLPKVSKKVDKKTPVKSNLIKASKPNNVKPKLKTTTNNDD